MTAKDRRQRAEWIRNTGLPELHTLAQARALTPQELAEQHDLQHELRYYQRYRIISTKKGGKFVKTA